MDELVHDLYGAPDGRWLIVSGAVGGHIPPPYINDLMNLGTTADVFTKLYNRMAEVRRTSRAPFQAQIAVLAGTNQRNVSRYIAGTSRPRVDSIDWSAIVRTLYSLGERGSQADGARDTLPD